MTIIELTVILLVFILICSSIIVVSFLSEISQPKYLKNNVNIEISNLVNIIHRNPIKILAITLFNVFIFISCFTSFQLEKKNSMGHVIDISAILITIFIAYLFTKLFMQRSELIELNKSLKPLAFKLTGYRRLLYFLTASDEFWIKKSEIQIAKIRHPEIGYMELEVNLESDYEKIKSFNEDKQFSSTRVLIYYIMQEIIKQRYEGWKFNWNDEIVYPKNIVEHLDHPTNQLWYYFDYKYYKHTNGLFDFNALSHSYYYNDILKQIKLLSPEYSDLTLVDNKVIGKISAEIKQDVIERMLELNNVVLFTRDMKLIMHLSQIILLFGLIFPIFFENFVSIEIARKYIYIISHMAITTVIIVLIFKLQSIINNEIKTS